jgi:hypothetical protein
MILAIDAGLTAPGIAVLDSQTLAVVHLECFRPKYKDKKDGVTGFNVGRISEHAVRILELYKEWRPETIVIEYPTGGAMSAGAIRGMAMSTAFTAASVACIKHLFDANLEVYPVTPLNSKKNSTGITNWHAADGDKNTVLRSISKLWPGIVWPRMKRPPKDQPDKIDESTAWAMSDALSAAVTYLLAKNRIDLNATHPTRLKNFLF